MNFGRSPDPWHPDIVLKCWQAQLLCYCISHLFWYLSLFFSLFGSRFFGCCFVVCFWFVHFVFMWCDCYLCVDALCVCPLCVCQRSSSQTSCWELEEEQKVVCLPFVRLFVAQCACMLLLDVLHWCVVSTLLRFLSWNCVGVVRVVFVTCVGWRFICLCLCSGCFSQTTTFVF